jgi:hypothetical protein
MGVEQAKKDMKSTKKQRQEKKKREKQQKAKKNNHKIISADKCLLKMMKMINCYSIIIILL